MRERDVYAFFNNDWRGHAVANAIDLSRLVDGSRELPSTKSA